MRMPSVRRRPKPLPWRFDDGGLRIAALDGLVDSRQAKGDCTVRAIAIALGLGYHEVAKGLDDLMRERLYFGDEVPDNVWLSLRGVPTTITRSYLADRGWTWVPTMAIGSGCRVHLARHELPACTVIARVTKHIVAVEYDPEYIRGHLVRDTHDPGRGGTRCVYGFWVPEDHGWARSS